MSTALLVYTAQSKNFFYCRDAVCQYVFTQGAIPLNPFRAFDYFLNDRVDRDLVRRGNRRLIEASDEVWIFGSTLADGVLIELALAIQLSKDVRYFTIENRADDIKETSPNSLDIETEVLDRTGLDRGVLLSQLLKGGAESLVHALGRTRELSGNP